MIRQVRAKAGIPEPRLPRVKPKGTPVAPAGKPAGKPKAEDFLP